MTQLLLIPTRNPVSKQYWNQGEEPCSRPDRQEATVFRLISALAMAAALAGCVAPYPGYPGYYDPSYAYGYGYPYAYGYPYGGYPAYYYGPSFGFAYWGGGCCYHGWHGGGWHGGGGGWHGGGWHGGGGGWHGGGGGGGGTWQGGGGEHGGRH